MGRVSLALLVLLCACGSDPGPAPPAGDADARPVETGVPAPTSTGVTWSGPQPSLEPEEQVQGMPANLGVTLAPPGALVTFWRTRGGEGSGPCADGVCLGLLDPELVGTATADETGSAVLVVDVPPDAEPAEWLLQASVVDPATGAATTTQVELRHVSVSSVDARVGFGKVTAIAGLARVHTTGNSHTGGAVWADVDGDWWPDLFIVNGAGAERALYLNNGDGSFRDASAAVVKAGEVEDAGAVAADFDRDGDIDIVIAVDNPTPVDITVAQPYEGGPNEYLRNDGGGRFTEIGAESGVVDPRGWRTSTLAAADYDHDGFVDLWMGTWAMHQLPGGDNFGRLLRNDGAGGFTDVAGPDGHGRDALASLWLDADLDTWPDLYVGNVSDVLALPDFDPRDVFYRNAGGVLTDATGDSPGLGDDAWAAMGADAADVDNDGDLDLYVTNLFHLPTPLPRGNPLYLGNGDGTFSDNVCDLAEVCAGHETWPAVFADFDRDKWVDLYVGTSMFGDPDLLFLNDGDGTFSSVRVADFHDDISRGGAQADFDGDGAVDLFVWMWGQDSRLYRAIPRDAHHWLELKLLGTESNPDAIGAWLEITSGGTRQLRWVSGGDSAHSQRDTVVHVGLGDDTEAAVTVHWPSGRVQDLGTFSALDRLYAIDEDAGVLGEVVSASATFDPDAGALTVRATSSYRGRSHLRIEGLGDLPWSATEGEYRATFALAGPPPAAVRVRSEWGALAETPVAAP